MKGLGILVRLDGLVSRLRSEPPCLHDTLDVADARRNPMAAALHVHRFAGSVTIAVLGFWLFWPGLVPAEWGLVLLGLLWPASIALVEAQTLASQRNALEVAESVARSSDLELWSLVIEIDGLIVDEVKELRDLMCQAKQ